MGCSVRSVSCLVECGAGRGDIGYLKNVKDAVDSFVQEAEQFDDLTMLSFKYIGPKGPEGSDATVEELTLEARTENISQVTAFIDERLEARDCSIKAQMQIDVALDELFANIASYAYAPGTGDATIRFSFDEETRTVTIAFLDRGIPFDPLKSADPDVTLSVEEREVGGLGIFLVKKTMDAMEYRYEDGYNIVTIRKVI